MPPISSAPVRAAPSAKAIAKKKAIQKMQATLRWHERDRKQRKQRKTEQYEYKRYRLELVKQQHNKVRNIARNALRDVREDWKLGPLRPNRVSGLQEGMYGVVTERSLSLTALPKHLSQRINEDREKQGLPPQHLVVNDKIYLPYVVGDRVVVIAGREKGKIGAIQAVDKDALMFTVQGVNTQYLDSKLLAGGDPTDKTNRAPHEIQFGINDIRLVIPYRITTASGRYIYQDVVVDNVILERHTTGVDPFTGIDYGNDEFPAEHRFDPETNLPVFKRYIAGTKRAIPWPWEKDEEKLKEKEDAVVAQEKPGFLTRVRRLPNDLRERIAARRNAAARAEEKRLEREAEELSLVDSDIAESQQLSGTRTDRPDNILTYDDDTGRNKSDPTDETLRNFSPTLAYPPFPAGLPTELLQEVREKRREAAQDALDEDTPRVSRAERRKIRENERKKREMETMKTPLQLRWEVMRAKQAAEKKEVDREQLLLALGKHMQGNGIELTPKRSQAARNAEKQLDVE
ncbi:hypothetical protein DM02DRAFT_620457 [Periconia macrospinosa]|uniref:KOW domain-containing protein n=1 Tax=Periconia macrospinosa TaxID=97972 RepID=A0A2V1D1Q4_9PLEO|nr:hypothetical protein DM02DRAFT_620457 [Periconia macrospinosa]